MRILVLLSLALATVFSSTNVNAATITAGRNVLVQSNGSHGILKLSLGDDSEIEF